jgi:hypothetical protein
MQTRERNIHAVSGIQMRDPSIQGAEDLRLGPHSHRFQHSLKAVALALDSELVPLLLR